VDIAGLTGLIAGLQIQPNLVRPKGEGGLPSGANFPGGEWNRFQKAEGQLPGGDRFGQPGWGPTVLGGGDGMGEGSGKRRGDRLVGGGPSLLDAVAHETEGDAVGELRLRELSGGQDVWAEGPQGGEHGGRLPQPPSSSRGGDLFQSSNSSQTKLNKERTG